MGLAADILYTTIFGSASPTHPEWQSFGRGFSMCCRNGKSIPEVRHFHWAIVESMLTLPLIQVLRSCDIGSDGLLSLIWTTVLHNADDLCGSLVVRELDVAASVHMFREHVAGTSDSGATMETLLTDFLRGSGISFSSGFDEVRGSFDALVDLSRIDSSAFRPRMFSWAATGSPSLDLQSSPINVSLYSAAR